ncbi:MAG: glycosyltransferase [Paramuribaculum sp.]|nr:glycosyltransferase [Paramuribaculum sp.]
MKDYGLVSIITPSFNCSKYVKETIKSIIAQTYKNWELLITDDCSTDNSRAIIHEFCELDPRIKIFCLDNNSGAGIARNNSIKEAKGRFIAFCDSDDQWHPEKLEKQLAFMEEKGCEMSYSSYMTCNEAGKAVGIVVCRRRETLSTLKRDDKIGCLTLIYNAEKIGKVYLPKLRKRQDWAMKLKILKICGQALGIKEPLAYYRLRSDSISHKKRSLIKYNIAVYQDVFGWSNLHASLFFLFIFMPSFVLKKIGLKYINQ